MQNVRGLWSTKAAKLSSFQEEPEKPESKEFPVERAVFVLPGGQLATEKGERLPGTIDPLFVHRADGIVRRVGGDGDGDIMRRMGQHGGLAQGGLHGLERLLPLRHPVDSLARGLVLKSPRTAGA